MADVADTAHEYEERDRAAALAAHRAGLNALSIRLRRDIDGTCIDCAELIEPARIAALRVTSRCAACAAEFERRLRHG